MAAEHIGPYELHGVLATDAMTRVWHAWDPAFKREVAIRELVFDPQTAPLVREEMGERFVDEARKEALLQHSGIVTTYAADVWDGRPALVMELVEGETLADALRRGRLRPSNAIAILDQLLDAIGYAHSRGAVHCDIKPDNIIVTPAGTVKLDGFVVARFSGPSLQGTQGTPGYMSPEQASGLPTDERSDLFTLGVVGYEMLTGNNPFGRTDGTDAATLIQRTMHEAIPAMPDIVVEGLSVDPRPAIMSALATYPADRPQTTDEFYALLHGHSLVQGFIPSAQVAPDARPSNLQISAMGGRQAATQTGGSTGGAEGMGDAVDASLKAGRLVDGEGFVSSVQPGSHSFAPAAAYNGAAQAARAVPRKGMPVWLPYALAGCIALMGLAFVLGTAFGNRGAGVGSEGAADTGAQTIVSDAAEDDTLAEHEQTGSADVSVRENLSEYSWDELKAIAVAIENCQSATEAYAVAEEYNLVDFTGSFYSASKSIDMNDGQSLTVKLVGIWHDDADTASGKAGLTFLADNAVYRHQMSNKTTMPGGWQESKLRAWLSSRLYQQFPTEVSSHFLPVYKRTNNTGVSASVTSVTETIDMLWVPSLVELTGPLNWEYYSHPENRDAYNAIFNAEGEQYAAFEQAGIISDSANHVLDFGEPWWTRSSAPASSRSRYVGSDGDPAQYGDANQNLAVIVGFCL